MAANSAPTASAFSQIGVAIVPGAMTIDVDPEQHEFPAKRLRQAFEAEFRRAVGAKEGHGVLAADRGHHDDSPRRTLARPVGAEQRREGLGHDERGCEVHLDLPPEFLRLQMEQGAGNGDASVVDETRERPRSERGGGRLRRTRDGRFVGDVEEKRRDGRAEGSLREPLRVLGLANAGKDPKPAPRSEP